MPENYLMGLIGSGIGIFICLVIFGLKYKRFSISVPIEQGYRLKEILSWAVNDREMMKRLAITAGILISLRFAFQIPLPGVDISAFSDFLRRMSQVSGRGITNMVISGAYERTSIFGLGIMPFFISCGLIQLASIFVPGLRKLSFGGESGREKISKYTYLLTIIVCIAQSHTMSMWLENAEGSLGIRIVTMHGLSLKLMTMATMTAAVVFLLFIADIITRYGIGNGVVVIAVSYLPFKIFSAADQAWFLTKSGQLPVSPVLLVIILFAIIYLFFNITNRAKAIDKTSIYLRPSIAGLAPLGYAQSILLLPVSIASLTNSSWGGISEGSITYSLVYVILIFVCTCLYARLVFSPRYISDLVSKYSYSGVSQGHLNMDDLKYNMTRVLIFASLVFVAIVLLRNLSSVLIKLPYLIVSLMEGVGIVCAVGFLSDIMRQLEFFKNKKGSGISEWIICYTAFDEIEATIKSEFLKSKGIPALVEPLRFTWGMPIRTIVDQYRIYTPTNKREEARSLIK